MALVDLSSDLSRFRSEVSKEPKNNPESSKATNNKNFATFQPISAKISQFGQDIKRQEPKQLEDRLGSTKLDDVRKFVEQNLLINTVSKYSKIDEDYSLQTMNVPTEMVSKTYGTIRSSEFISRLTTSDILPIKQQQGIYNNISPTDVVKDTSEQSNNVVNPDTQITRPTQTFDREGTSPDVTPLPGEQTNNIVNPDIEVLPKPLTFDRTGQSVEISKDLVSQTGNVTDPKTVLDINTLTYDRVDQSPFILTDTKQDGFVQNPNIRVFRFDGTTVQTEDNSRLNLDGLPLRFVPISRLDGFELPREVDVERYIGESQQLEDNSRLNVDAVIKTIPFGRHENPDGSRFSVIGTQQVNFFTDTNAKGFVVKQQKGETLYSNNSTLGWNGSRTSAPTTNFFTDVNAKGFTSFVPSGETQYETESSTFGFTTIQSTNFFDVTKTHTSEGFKTFSTLFESDYKEDSSVFTFTGPSQNAPSVNYFDITGTVSSDGFTKFIQIYDTKYIPDSSVFTWIGNRSESPDINVFDITGTSTTAGFHRFAQLYDSKYLTDASIFVWKGTAEESPEVNYFDINGTSTTAGFHKFAQLYDTKYVADASRFDWDGSRDDAPEINYFDLTGTVTTTGFHKFAQLYDTKYIAESSRFDWDGNKDTAPEVNYFDLNKKNTTVGFHRFAQLYDTKYVHESSGFDWDGNRSNAPSVNYFDLTSANTNAGFHTFAQTYDTKYIHESSRFDWDGTRADSPEVNFFDLNKQHQTVGFHKLAQKYDTKYIKDASNFDFDGGYRDAPEVDFFDLDKRFVSKGFEKFTQQYISRYIKDSSRFDFDGGKNDAPETDYFDITKKNTSKGFEKFPQLLVTRYVKDSSQFDFDGTSRNAPTVNYFPNTNASGFTSFVQKLQTEYVPDSSEYTFKGTLPTEINFFPDDNQSGFINKTPLLETKYVKDSSRFTFTGTLPEPVDFLENTNAEGFHLKAAPLETKYIADISRFTFKGTRQDAPTTDYFPNDFNEGFVKLTSPLETTFKSDISRFTFKGTRQDAPGVDYLQNIPADGFRTLVPSLETFYNKETSRFAWNGTRQDAPQVDFFKIQGSNPNAIRGFDRLFTDVTDSKLTGGNSRFSFGAVKNYSSVKNVPYTKFFGFNPNERSGFLVNMIDRNSSLYPLLDPSLSVDSPADIRFAIEGGRSKVSRQRTTDNVGKYAPITLGGLFWSDGTNTGTATLGNQVPFMKVKSEGFGSTYFRKYEKNAKDSTQGLGYLTKWATTRRSPSPLDNQYNKFKLQAESTNSEPAFFHQPYVVRGIQRDGEVENQRWGFGVTFDDGIVRGGAVTQAERILMDVARLGKWTASVKGVLFNLKQVGLQLMNPSVDVDPNTPTSGFLGQSATRIFNPVALLANVASARAGFHIARHGLVSFDSDYLNKYEKATINRELNERFLSSTKDSFDNLPPILPGDQTNYNRLIGLMKELLPNSFKPNTSKENIPPVPSGPPTLQQAKEAALRATKALTGDATITRLSSLFGGPQSFFGIGGTTIRRSSHPYLTLYTTSPNLSVSNTNNTSKEESNANRAASSLGGIATTAASSLGPVGDSLKNLSQTEPQYPQSAKRDLFFAHGYTYKDYITNTKGNALLKSLIDYFNDPNGMTDAPLSINQPTMRKIAASQTAEGFFPRYELETARTIHVNEFNAQGLKGTFLSDGPANLAKDDLSQPNAIKRYRTANYDQLKRNTRNRSRDFNDFRGNITLDDSTATYITRPDLARFDDRNLTDKFGFGEHGTPGVQRDTPATNTIEYKQFAKEGIFNQGDSVFNDYAVATEKTIGGTPLKFRGDRINIIDYKRANFNINTNLVYEKGEYTTGVPGKDDLVEFYFSSLVLSGHKNCPAEVIVFRATFDSISDNHNPSWNSVKYMGRADPLYTYQGYEREISFGFTVHIGSRDEMKASWRKLNYLASWTAPEYLKSGLMRGPMVRLNIGHLYRKMPGYISSLSYTFDNSQTTWETAKLPEDMFLRNTGEAGAAGDLSRPGVLQLPKHIQVSVSFVPVGVYRPEFRGIMYSLYDDRTNDNQPETGLMPISSTTRVNYFREFDDTNVIYSGVEPGKSAAEGHYGLPGNAAQKIEYSTDISGSN
jgi:hypothetical protein